MTLFGIEISSPFHLHSNALAKTRRLWVNGQDITLANLPPGRQAVVARYLPGMSSERYAQLHAYGLAPGSLVSVVQHTPVTVIRIEHLELALEGELAKEIQVTLAE